MLAGPGQPRSQYRALYALPSHLTPQDLEEHRRVAVIYFLTPQTARYVRVAIGQDYAEVTPTRGVYVGRAGEALSIHVRVRPA